MSERLSCSDGNCVFAWDREPGGMHTNGGCNCVRNLKEWGGKELGWAYSERSMRRVIQEYRLIRKAYHAAAEEK